jgi:lipopolysaccharide transport system ATP-binding protein
MKPIIRVENLAKQYRLGARAASASDTLREALVRGARAPLEWVRGGRQSARETVWALRDVTFDVQPGEVVGIVGQNGAGKSTLLKILSRITEPTSGRASLYGRVVSLLEVGTGFHHELSGRENIFLNGAILGMRQGEIRRKFDEIVAFSEIEKFIDTPVKHYSSGMYMRLAFAVAAHLEPEILIVDEVLAVGDSSFQRKCLDKMQDVGRHGRTVLFVSHNMPAVVRLCPRAIMLREGRVVEDGPAHFVTSAHLNAGAKITSACEWPSAAEAPGDDTVRLRAVRLETEDGQPADLIDIRLPLTVVLEYDVLKPGRRLSGGILCNNESGSCVFSSADLSAESIYGQDPEFTGRRTTRCTIPGNLMSEGVFTITAAVYAILDGIHTHARADDVVGFRIVDPVEGDSARGIYVGPVAGIVRPRLAWSTEQAPASQGERGLV